MEREIQQYEITIEDVKLAIKIINTWLDQHDQVMKTMLRLKRYIGRERIASGFDLGSIIQAVLAESQRRKEESGLLASTDEEVTEEDIARLRAISEKIKKKEVKG